MAPPLGLVKWIAWCSRSIGMKRCPHYGRDYDDDSLSFCIDDGSELLFGPAVSEPGPVATGFRSDDEPQTAILHETAPPGEAAPRAQIHTTERTAVLPSGSAEIPAPKRFDKRLLFAPIVLVVIALGGFFGYRYFTPISRNRLLFVRLRSLGSL